MQHRFKNFYFFKLKNDFSIKILQAFAVPATERYLFGLFLGLKCCRNF